MTLQTALLRAGWAAALLLLAVASGCGSSKGGEPGVPAAFQKKALAVCKRAAAEMRAEGPFPYPDFNPTRPDWGKYPGVARALVETPRIFRRWQRNMEALGQPATGSAAWNDLLAAIDRHVRIASEQQVAASRHDSETFTKDYHAGRDTQDDVLRAATDAGVPECAAVDR